MTTQMTELDVMEAIDACPALVEFKLACYEVKDGLATILSMGHFFRCVVAIDDLMWTLEYWRYNGVYGDLPVDAPIAVMSMRHMTRLAGVIETIAMEEDRDVAPADLPTVAPVAPVAPVAEKPVKQTDAMKIMSVTDAIVRVPLLAILKMYCSGSHGGMVTISSDRYYVRFSMSYDDAMWVFGYWGDNGVTSVFPADAPISAVSALAILRMSDFAERTMREDSKARVIVYDNPMVSMLESDYLANVARLKDLTEQVSVLKTMLAGMKLERDMQEEIIASSDRELDRLNALLSLPNKAKKRKPLAVEQIAIMWLSLPKTAENLMGITTCKSGGFIAHTSYTDLWFATVKHAQGFTQAWAIEGERPSLSNLRVGMKAMRGDDDV